MIYFVLCPSFQGATLLSLLLNNHSQLLALGDTNPTRSFDQRCSCGEKVSACGFWQGVVRHTDADRFAAHETLLPRYPRFFANRRANQAANLLLARLPRPLAGAVAHVVRPVAEFRDAYLRFLAYSRQVAAHTHFIEGEKSVLKYLVSQALGFETGGAIHLVRDPRGYVNSRLNDDSSLTLEDAAREWKYFHGLILRFARRGRYHRMIYEQLVQDPEAELERLLAFIGVAPEPLARAPDVPAKHHLMGNAMVFRFDGTIHGNEKWRERFSAEEQARIAALTEPLFSTFGYSL